MNESDEDDIIQIKMTPKMRAFLDAVVVGRETQRRQVEALWRKQQAEAPMPPEAFPPGHPASFLSRPSIRRPGPALDESDVAQYALDLGLAMILHQITASVHGHHHGTPSLPPLEFGPGSEGQGGGDGGGALQ